MKIIKEFWEFQKNIYGQEKFQNDSEQELQDFIDDVEPYDGKWVLTKKDEKIFIKELKDGEFFGHDDYGNEVSGQISDIEEVLTNENKS